MCTCVCVYEKLLTEIHDGKIAMRTEKFSPCANRLCNGSLAVVVVDTVQ